mmetsp:Transcript_42150/g.67753  ORF Transcript_42150/g.67753 Transcript_42150/m.67753 type:complete len:200 (+) Transcript_42150:897-1496(+)
MVWISFDAASCCSRTRCSCPTSDRALRTLSYSTFAERFSTIFLVARCSCRRQRPICRASCFKSSLMCFCSELDFSFCASTIFSFPHFALCSSLHSLIAGCSLLSTRASWSSRNATISSARSSDALCVFIVCRASGLQSWSTLFCLEFESVFGHSRDVWGAIKLRPGCLPGCSRLSADRLLSCQPPILYAVCVFSARLTS